MDNATGIQLPLNLPGNPEFDYLSREAPWLLIDGEPYAHNKGCRPAPQGSFNPMCVSGSSIPAGTTTHEAGGATTVRLRNHHYTSFSFARNCAYLRAMGKSCTEPAEALDYWRNSSLESEIVNEWKLPHSAQYPIYATTHLQYLTDHIGYRLELTTAHVPASICRAGRLSFNATLVNYGFAAPMNPRPVLAVLIAASPTATLDAANDHGTPRAHAPAGISTLAPIVLGAFDVDVREWQPYLPGDPYFYAIDHTISLSPVALPPEVTAGTYQLGLYLPDPRAAQQNEDARFAIRLANDNVPWWTTSGRYGVNVIATLNVAD